MEGPTNSHEFIQDVGQDLLVLRTWAIAWCRIPCNKSWCETEEIWRWQDWVDRDRGPAKDGGSLATNSTFLTKKTYVLQGRFWETDFYLFGDLFSVFRSRMLLLEFNTPSSSWPSGWHSEGEGMTQLDASAPLLFGVMPLRFLAVAGRINCQKSPLRVQVTTRDCAAELKMAAIWSVFLLSHCFLRHYVMILLCIYSIDINDIISLFVRQNRMIFLFFHILLLVTFVCAFQLPSVVPSFRKAPVIRCLEECWFGMCLRIDDQISGQPGYSPFPLSWMVFGAFAMGTHGQSAGFAPEAPVDSSELCFKVFGLTPRDLFAHDAEQRSCLMLKLKKDFLHTSFADMVGRARLLLRCKRFKRIFLLPLPFAMKKGLLIQSV